MNELDMKGLPKMRVIYTLQLKVMMNWFTKENSLHSNLPRGVIL